MLKPGGRPLARLVAMPGPVTGQRNGTPCAAPVSAGLVMSGLASSSAFRSATSVGVKTLEKMWIRLTLPLPMSPPLSLKKRRVLALETTP